MLLKPTGRGVVWVALLYIRANLEIHQGHPGRTALFYVKTSFGIAKANTSMSWHVVYGNMMYHACMHVCMYVCMYACMYQCMQMYNYRLHESIHDIVEYHHTVVIYQNWF